MMMRVIKQRKQSLAHSTEDIFSQKSPQLSQPLNVFPKERRMAKSTEIGKRKKDSGTTLVEAASKGDLETVSFLLSHGAALQFFSSGKVETSDLSLKSKNTRFLNKALLIAVENGNVAIAMKLLDAGANEVSHSLSISASKDDKEMTRLLLERASTQQLLEASALEAAIIVARNSPRRETVPLLEKKKMEIQLETGKKEYDDFHSVKMILLGHESVGKVRTSKPFFDSFQFFQKKKTTLVTRLLDKCIHKKSKNISTNGVERSEIREVTKEGLKVKYEIFDFGAQEIFHYLFDFFMTERAVYLVLFDTSSANYLKDIQHWLSNIEVRVELSEVALLFVGTHVDLLKRVERKERTKKVEQEILELLNKSYKRAKTLGLCFVDSTSFRKKRISRLLSICNELVSKLKHKLVDARPPLFSKVLQALSLYQHDPTLCQTQRWATFPVAQVSRFLEMPIFKGDDPSQLRKAILHAHSTGNLIFVDLPNLRDTIVLDPIWLSTRMTDLISFNTHFVNGIVPQGVLEKLWPCFSESQRAKCVDLICAFELVYKRPNGDLIIPSLVSQKPPETLHREIRSRLTNLLKRKIEFPSRLPRSFFSRLVVRLAADKELQVEQVWQGGVIVSNRNPELYGNFNMDDFTFAALVIDKEEEIRKNKDFECFTPENAGGSIVRLCSQIHHTEKTSVRPPLIHRLLLVFESIVADVLSQSHKDKVRQFVVYKNHCIPLSKCILTFLSNGPNAKLFSATGDAITVEKLCPEITLGHLAIPRDRIEQLALLGTGRFGRVFKAKIDMPKKESEWKGSSRRFRELEKKLLMQPMVALKQLDLHTKQDPFQLAIRFKEFQAEVEVMRRLECPTIVQLYGIERTTVVDSEKEGKNFTVRMVMEYCPLGDLYTALHLTKQGILLSDPWSQETVNLKLKISLDVANAMLYLHSQSPPIVHRDLRSKNVFLVSFDPNESVCAKVRKLRLSEKTFFKPFFFY